MVGIEALDLIQCPTAAMRALSNEWRNITRVFCPGVRMITECILLASFWARSGLGSMVSPYIGKGTSPTGRAQIANFAELHTSADLYS